MTEIMNQKWVEVFSDAEFGRALLAMTPEDALKALREKGFDFSKEDLAEYAAELTKAYDEINSAGELDVDQLESVAGGKGHIASYAGGVGLGLICVAVGAGIAFGW